MAFRQLFLSHNSSVSLQKMEMNFSETKTVFWEITLERRVFRGNITENKCSKSLGDIAAKYVFESTFW